MEKWQEEDYEAIIIITCSADLSGTNNGFHLAKDTVGLDNVYIYDSRCSYYGYGYLCKTTCR